MKMLLGLLLAFTLLGCARTESVAIPDHKGIIDSNTARIALLEAQYNLQNLRMDALELRISSLESSLSLLDQSLNAEISNLQANVQNQLNALLAQNNYNANAINAIQGQISSLQGNIASMQSQIASILPKLVSVVYPCGAGNSQEVLLQTQNGLVAYFQIMSTVTQTFQAGVTIPQYFVCTQWGNGNGNERECKKGMHVAASVAQASTTISYQVLQRAYLDVLADGNYSTTDGYSCNFAVVNGGLQ